jgi:hypothetical protein
MDASHYALLETELFGAWEAVRSASMPELIQAFETPEDPLRDGSVPDSRAIPEFHASRERDARKNKRREAKVVEETPPEVASPETSTENYYEEY